MANEYLDIVRAELGGSPNSTDALTLRILEKAEKKMSEKEDIKSDRGDE